MNPAHAVVVMNGGVRTQHDGARRDVSHAEGVLMMALLAAVIITFIIMVRRLK